jgi:hypothetical protein
MCQTEILSLKDVFPRFRLQLLSNTMAYNTSRAYTLPYTLGENADGLL